jgi:hypothetical protein
LAHPFACKVPRSDLVDLWFDPNAQLNLWVGNIILSLFVQTPGIWTWDFLLYILSIWIFCSSVPLKQWILLLQNETFFFFFIFLFFTSFIFSFLVHLLGYYFLFLEKVKKNFFI